MATPPDLPLPLRLQLLAQAEAEAEAMRVSGATWGRAQGGNGALWWWEDTWGQRPLGVGGIQEDSAPWGWLKENSAPWWWLRVHPYGRTAPPGGGGGYAHTR